MNLKRILLVCLAVTLVPVGMVLLLPFAARAFGGFAAGLRAQLIGVSVIGWLVYSNIKHGKAET
jgi:hypothetical protein